MNKKIWDLYAPIYEKAMRGDRKAYGLMYERIPQVIQGKDVLEVATGPGLLAKHVAYAAHKMIATDIIRHDLQHEELLVCYPQKWVSEVEHCCGILTGG